MSLEDVKPQGQPSLRPGLTKRQTEVLDRLEQGMPVKKIAKDMGVTRAAVYQTIERLRRAGAVADTYTPSGQPASDRGAPAVGAAVALGPALAYELGRADAAGESGLAPELAEAALRRLGGLPDAGATPS